MSLELAERMRGIDVDQAWEEIRTAKDTTSDALAEMRMWARALNPVRDAGARGLAALELIAESFRGTGLTVDVSGDEASDRELASDDEVALLIYRAVQEGLTNALRHSRARTVRIFLAVKERRMELAAPSTTSDGPRPPNRRSQYPTSGSGCEEFPIAPQSMAGPCTPAELTASSTSTSLCRSAALAPPAERRRRDQSRLDTSAVG